MEPLRADCRCSPADLIALVARLPPRVPPPPGLVDACAWWLLRLHPRRRRLWRRLRRLLEARLWAALPTPVALGARTAWLRGHIWAIGWRRRDGDPVWRITVY